MLANGLKGKGGRIATGHQHHTARFKGVRAADQQEGFPHPAAGAITFYGVANTFFGCGQTIKQKRLIRLMPDLHQHGGCAPFFAFGCNGQKVGAFLQTLHDVLGRQTLATLGAAVGDNLTAANSGHTGAETMAAGADEFARLISPFHGVFSSKIEAGL